MLCLVTRSCLTLCDTVNCRCHRLLCPRGFSRQEYWSGLPNPPPGDLSNSGIEPRSPTKQTDSLLSEPPGKPCTWMPNSKILALTEVHMGKCLGSYYVCACVCALVEDCLPAEDPEFVIPFISPCKTDQFFSHTLSFVIRNQGS